MCVEKVKQTIASLLLALAYLMHRIFSLKARLFLTWLLRRIHLFISFTFTWWLRQDSMAPPNRNHINNPQIIISQMQKMSQGEYLISTNSKLHKVLVVQVDYAVLSMSWMGCRMLALLVSTTQPFMTISSSIKWAFSRWNMMSNSHWSHKKHRKEQSVYRNDAFLHWNSFTRTIPMVRWNSINTRPYKLTNIHSMYIPRFRSTDPSSPPHNEWTPILPTRSAQPVSAKTISFSKNSPSVIAQSLRNCNRNWKTSTYAVVSAWDNFSARPYIMQIKMHETKL